jgi:hypothetical protein
MYQGEASSLHKKEHPDAIFSFKCAVHLPDDGQKQAEMCCRKLKNLQRSYCVVSEYVRDLD